MNLTVLVDPTACSRWTTILLRRIEAEPDIVLTIDARARSRRPSAAAAGLLYVEAMLVRRSRLGWAAPDAVTGGRGGDRHHGAADLVLDLADAAGDVSGGTARLWRLTFDDRPGEETLLAALIAGRSPVVAVKEGERTVAAARVGTESHDHLLTAFEDGLARTTTLVMSALRNRAAPHDFASARGSGAIAPSASTDAAPGAVSLGAAAHHLSRRTARMLGRGIRRLGFRRMHWRVGWRRLDGPDLIDLRAHPETGWHDLPDDGTRFYADPFAIDHEGRTVLFVEDYQYRRAKAVISAVAFDANGPVGAPVPVLDEPHHLSYPFVFARDGEVWMIPESCAARTVDLYRATAFPGGWVKEATLLSDVVASDATLVEHGGRWWMLATVREAVPTAESLPPRGSFSDALHVWSAPDFRGPWRAHPGNPVLIDIASARPAGRIVARDGHLIRPVQDGRRGYGAALSLASIDRLDDTGFGQTVLTTLGPGPRWPGTCLHTLNRSERFEFIDGAGPVPRFGARG